MTAGPKPGRILRNGVWNAGAFGITTVTLLAVMPLFIRFLGIERFGIFTLLTSLTAPLGVLNAGIGQATTKFVAQFEASGDSPRVRRLVGTTLLLNTLVGIVGLLILYMFAETIATHWFNIESRLVGESIRAFELVGCVWLLTQISNTFQAVVVGHQQYKTLAITSSILQVTTYAGAVLTAYGSRRLDIVMYWNVAAAAIGVLAWYLVARQYLPGLACWPVWDADSARICYGYSSWQMLDVFVATISNQADRMLLGTFTSAALVGIYGVAISVQTRAVGLVWSLLGTIFPAVSAAGEGSGAAERTLLDCSFPIMIVAGAVYSSVFALSSDFLMLWLGPDIGLQAARLVRVLMGVALVSLPTSLLVQYLLGKGLTRLNTLLDIGSGIVSIAVTALAIKAYGLMGAAWGALMGLAFIRPFLHWVVYRRCFKGVVAARDFTIRLHGILISTVVAAACTYLVTCSLGMLPPGYVRFLLAAVIVPPMAIAAILATEYYLLRQRREVMLFAARLRNVISRIAAR